MLFGSPISKFGNNYYQIVGLGSKYFNTKTGPKLGPATLTWMEAYNDARSRCYQGMQGYLVNIGSQAENDFVSGLLEADPGFDNDDAWIGATDHVTEGVFAWIGPGKMSAGTVFWQGGLNGGPVAGAYTNFADGEPNEGGNSKASEDCISMYGSTAGQNKWYDKNCYLTNGYFIVEFGTPTVVSEWNSQHDDKI